MTSMHKLRCYCVKLATCLANFCQSLMNQMKSFDLKTEGARQNIAGPTVAAVNQLQLLPRYSDSRRRWLSQYNSWLGDSSFHSF